MAVSQSLTLTESSVDTVANTSKVKIVWKSTQTGESYNSTERTAKYWITINGGTKTQYTVTYTLPKGSTKTILSKTITVSHKSDGSGTVKVDTWMDTRISAGEVELSKTLKLTTIARASTIGATNAYIESTSIIGINKKSEKYTNSVQFSFGDLVGYIDDGGNITSTEVKHAGSSVPFFIPRSFYDYMPNKSSQSCKLVCKTYNGSTLIGSNTATFTIKADPELCKPIISYSVKDVNPKSLAVTGNADYFVRYVSTARCAISAEALNSATISTLKVNGKATTGTLDISAVETGDFSFAATDSRGFTTEETESKILIPYMPPTLNAKVYRTDPTSGNAILEASGQCYVGDFGVKTNDITLKYRVNGREVSVPVMTNRDGVSFTATAEIVGLDYMKSHTVEVILADALEERTTTITVKPGVPVFDWGENDFAFHVPVSMSGKAITNLLSPVNEADAANKAYVDGKISISKVWTNSNTSAEFAAKTVSLSFASSEKALIYFTEGTDAAGYVHLVADYGHTCRVVGKYASSITNRGAKVTADGVTFTAGNRMLTYGEWSENNKVLIPVVIYKITGAT